MNIGFLRSNASMDELRDEMTALEKAGCERIVVDNASEPNAQAGMLGAVISRLSSGQSLIVWTLESVANSMPELIDLVLQLEEKNVRFRSLTEGFDSQGRNRATIKAIFTQLKQFESGLALRLQNETQSRFGRRVGRPRALSSEHIRRARELVEQGQAMDDVAREFRVSKATLYRYLSEDG
jgi:DNA invertase Pin-like site-specific DNA recombinase